MGHANQGQCTRVLIVDDHDVVAQGLGALIEDEPDIEVVGRAGSVADAVGLAAREFPTVVLMDYRLPDGSGADAARKIREMEAPPAIIMVTSVADRRVLGEALQAGCIGFVSKNADKADLVAAVRSAANDDSYFTRDMLKHLVHLRRFDKVDTPDLTSRECEVLQLTTNGLNTEEIAVRLFLSEHTVKNHIRHAMAKLDAHTKLDAVVKAVRTRMISIDG